MNVLGIGLWEILLIFALAFVILGPQDLGVLGRKAGRLLRQWLNSDEYLELQRTREALTSIPQKLMEETDLNQNMIDPSWAMPDGQRRKEHARLPGRPEEARESGRRENPELDPTLLEWANPSATRAGKRAGMLDSARKRMAAAADESQAPESDPASPDPINPASQT